MSGRGLSQLIIDPIGQWRILIMPLLKNATKKKYSEGTGGTAGEVFDSSKLHRAENSRVNSVGIDL